MSDPAYDPRDVLDKYVAALGTPNGAVIRDTGELAHPKDIIKFVLQHCLKTIEEPDKLRFLREAYVGLANFQELDDAQKRAVAVLAKLGPPGPEGSELQSEQAKRLRTVAIPLQVVLDRVKAENAVLVQELKTLPGGT